MLSKLLFYLAAAVATITSLPIQSEEVMLQCSENFEPFTGKVSGSKVRVRLQPTLEGFVVRETKNGELFAVVAEDKDFYCIQPPKEMKGYIYRTFVLDDAVEGERVNVRLQPDTDAPIIAQLNTGDKIHTKICASNNKWVEIELPQTCHLYIAKEYMENKGSIGLIAELEKQKIEASHSLSSACAFAKAEIQKSFEQIDFNSITLKFDDLIRQYHDISDISECAKEATSLLQEAYIQKKIAFLEGKADQTTKPFELDPSIRERLAALNIDIKQEASTQGALMKEVGKSAAQTFGIAATANQEITDKMLSWQPLEESVYHLWAGAQDGKDIVEFYQEEDENAIMLSGIIEEYNRPVKNRPGDFLLKNDNMPVAFLYSTKVNLQNVMGKKVRVKASPRPNNHFAYPAYHVLSIE